tara:strand:- start:171 stop:650 length:480 start_codon:yes stop_codon:yes gene_type:complete
MKFHPARFISADVSDLIFRALFCLIFVGLGFEHIFSDEMIQSLMPAWLPYKRGISIICGLWLISWGSLILTGFGVIWAALGLGSFLIVVTCLVHIPALFYNPSSIAPENHWIWQVLQRSNLVKNLCLLGVCIHLFNHDLGKYSLESFLSRKQKLPKESQ